MKKISIIILSGIAVVMLGSSCKKYLNINANPNQSTSSTPDAVLPQAIVYTAANISSFNDYGAELGGYAANAGGYGGFGSNWTYDFGPNDYAGLWSSTYDALEDLQFVLNSTQGDSLYPYHNAAARILKAYNYELLVDTYNNVPYTNALQGTTDLTPTYDDAKTLYPLLANELDTAIATIEAANTNVAEALTSGTDPLFGGNETSWIQFANTIKLRLIVRASAMVTFSNTTFDANGFLATDAVVNPGYQKATGQISPSWGDWVQTYTGGNGNRAWMPCTFVFSFYNGTKLSDNARGSVIYFDYPATPNNQLGVGLTTVPSAPATTNGWYSGSTTSLGSAPGIMKGPNMGEPLMLAAESYFLQAEANVRNIVSGTAKTNFYNGIEASFNYLYLLPDDKTLATGLDPVADAATYEANNATSYLVNYSLATTTAQQIEAIITQKYIALNFINSQEGWNEYRRTTYPKIVDGSQDGTLTFASTLSQSSRPDKLPSRLLYPASEYSYNSANVPTGISPYTSLIFWAQ